MRKSRNQRLDEIEKFLWEQSIFGATTKQIAEGVGVKVSSYLSELLEQLTSEDKVMGEKIPSSRGFMWRYYAVHSSVSQVKQVSSPTPLYTPLDNWKFDNNYCFLCGTNLSQDNRTDEHVFPAWLQKRYNLQNQKLQLLNGTEIPYKQVLIPCCQTCNGEFLSKLEGEIQRAHDKGFETFSRLPKIKIYQWLTKIFYGILFRELSLLQNRRDHSQGYIFSEEQLKEYHTLHEFLQSVRLPMIFCGFRPWSIFVVKIEHDTDLKLNFDFSDDISQLFFSIRMGEIGIIACLEDAGVQEHAWLELFRDIKILSLHPMQFDELCAMVHYRRTLMTRIPKYLMAIPDNTTDATKVYLMPGLSSKPVLLDWNPLDFVPYLMRYWGAYNFSSDFIYQPPDLVRTMLFNENRELLQLDSKGNVQKTIKVN